MVADLEATFEPSAAADPVPLTETDMVGSILQDQENKDREQYVFLTQEDAGMDTVKDQLADLTEHIHRLSMGEIDQQMEGPATDGPKRVEVEPALPTQLFSTTFSSCLSASGIPPWRPFCSGSGSAL